MTRKERVLDRLRSAGGAWLDGPELANAEVGGSEGLRRVRELRAEGYRIEERRHPDPRRAVRQYRLLEPPEGQQTLWP
jgi:biotin operon repressor